MSTARVFVGVAVLGLAAWAVTAYERAGQGDSGDVGAVSVGNWFAGLYGDAEDARDVAAVDPFSLAWSSLTAVIWRFSRFLAAAK